ncbi:DUF4347 domain-containing protein, partial [Pseudoxanthomonas sp. SGD-10]
LLGNTIIDSKTLKNHTAFAQVINQSVKAGGDFLLYGCELGKGETGDQFLEIIKSNTHADVAASNNLTGNTAFNGDWDLEIQKGDIEAQPLANSIAMKDFTEVLQLSGTKTFESWDGEILADDPTKDWDGFTTYISTLGTYQELIGGLNTNGLYVSMYSADSRFLIRSNPAGDAFGVTSLNIATPARGTGPATIVTIYGYEAGNSTPVGKKTNVDVANDDGTNIDLTTGITGSFSNIIQLRIKPDNDYFILNSVTFTAATPTNAAPTIDANGATAGTANTTTFTENGPAVRITTNLATLSDDDNIASLTLTLAATPNGSSELIGYDAALNGGVSLASVGLLASYNSTTRTYTLSGSATPAVYQNVLRAMVYNNISDAPNTTARTVTITATDAEGATGQATVTINIIAVNDAPTLTTSGGTTAFTEGTAVVIDNALTVADADNATLASANVSITSNLQNGQDVLAFTNNPAIMGNIAGSYNATTGVLTLTSSGATATKAQWQAALRAVMYNNTSDNPNTANRTISFTVNDGTASSTAATKTISVTAVNDAPTVTGLPTSLTFIEDATTAGLDLTGIAIADVDIGTGNMTLTFTASSGIFDIAAGTGLTISGHLTNVLSLTGSLTNIHNYLSQPTNIYYKPAANVNGANAATITLTATDNGNTGSGGANNVTLGTININITAVNDAPTATSVSVN